MSFPKRFFGLCIGWKDRGTTCVKRQLCKPTNKWVPMNLLCNRCKSITCIGIEKNTPFEYCPTCLTKIFRSEENTLFGNVVEGTNKEVKRRK